MLLEAGVTSNLGRPDTAAGGGSAVLRCAEDTSTERHQHRASYPDAERWTDEQGN